MQIAVQDINETVLSEQIVRTQDATNLNRKQHVVDLSMFKPNAQLHFQVSQNLRWLFY